MSEDAIKVFNFEKLNLKDVKFNTGSKGKSGDFVFIKMFYQRSPLIFNLQNVLTPFGSSFKYSKHTLELRITDEKIQEKFKEFDNLITEFMFNNFPLLFGNIQGVNPEDIKDLYSQSLKSFNSFPPYIRVKFPTDRQSGEISTEFILNKDGEEEMVLEHKENVLEGLVKPGTVLDNVVVHCSGCYISNNNGKVLCGVTYNVVSLSLTPPRLSSPDTTQSQNSEILEFSNSDSDTDQDIL